jgi:hypothetical protein
VTPPLRSGAAAQAGEQGGPACPDVLAHDSLGVVAVLGEDQLQDPVMLAVGLQRPARLTQRGRDQPGAGQLVHKHPVVRLEFGVVGAVDEQVVELLGSGSGPGCPRVRSGQAQHED